MVCKTVFTNFLFVIQFFGIVCPIEKRSEAFMAGKKTTAKDRVDKEMGRRLSEARQSKGYTQSYMAEQFGLTVQAYQNYEYGREMKSGMIVKTCAILECSPSWLLGVADEGARLPPDSPLLKRMRELMLQMNQAGQKEAVKRVGEMVERSEYRVEVKKTVPGDPVPDSVAV